MKYSFKLLLQILCFSSIVISCIPKKEIANNPKQKSVTKVKNIILLIGDGMGLSQVSVEELRLMGVDFIIGIDVQDTLKTRNDLKSAIEILGQVGNYSAIEAMIEKRKNTDIYIRPNITDFSVVSFREKSEIIAA